MKRLIYLGILFLAVMSCSENGTDAAIEASETVNFISAVDISSYPEIANSNPTFYNLSSDSQDFLNILKENGVNTIRLRLWVNPSNQHSGFNGVQQFSGTLKARGFKTWLSLHYSDDWADPGQQKVPEKWEGIPFADLKDSVYNYTKKVVQDINPDYIQIGNEINNGFLHPYGHFTNNNSQCIELLRSGISAVRDNSTNTQIILHFAGIAGADWFFNQVNNLNYDIIGLSYYPIWHGKSLQNLSNTMYQLANNYNRKIVIAETAYPFTLGWNDWTNNIVGLEDQLILPAYPATEQGQAQFIKKIRELTLETPNGIGFCYWGAELIAWKGTQATNASPWENQALFNFQNQALPVLREFKNN